MGRLKCDCEKEYHRNAKERLSCLTKRGKIVRKASKALETITIASTVNDDPAKELN
jgi:hypothetical protein